VAFYGTPAFKASVFATPPAIPVSISSDPDDPEVRAIAAFLRVLNALENIRSSINIAERGRTMGTADDMRDLARLSREEVVDAMQVLSTGALARQLDPGMLSARVRLLNAGLALESALKLGTRNGIDALLTTAILHLRAARSSLADPDTLPLSFRN
jgi:hypothetical protein